MRAKRRADVAEPRPYERSRLADPDGVQPALEITAPEFQKAAQLGEIRSRVELLPDEALQQVGVIRQMVDDLCGRQPIFAQRLLVVAHFAALLRFARSVPPACPIDRSSTTKKSYRTSD